MSAENVEVVRGIYASLGAMSGYADVRELIERVTTTDVEWAPIEAPNVFRGRDGVEEAFSAWFEAMEDFEVEVEELLDAGDRVVAVTRHTARGKGSRLQIEQRVFQVFTFRGDKIARFREFGERQAALQAAGLSE